MPRLSFSQRMGLTPKEFPLQVDSLDDATRMDIWNAFYRVFSDTMGEEYYIDRMPIIRKSLCDYIWTELLKQDASCLFSIENIVGKVKVMILHKQTPWYRVLDFCEYLMQWNRSSLHGFGKMLNELFEKNNVAYRVIGNEISPITDENEIQEIKTAMTLPDRFAGARMHITTALQLLSDRENPDYRNSIKESISAVESVCIVLDGNPSASLGKALKLLEGNGIKIHQSLKNGFSNIYGYTSDEGGIRHAMIEEGNIVTQEDALFMLVSCSAFCHYLQQKGAQAGLLS